MNAKNSNFIIFEKALYMKSGSMSLISINNNLFSIYILSYRCGESTCASSKRSLQALTPSGLCSFKNSLLMDLCMGFQVLIILVI